MLSIQTSSFEEDGWEQQQLSLFSEDTAKTEKQRKAEEAMDKIRLKFGKDAVTTANIINNDIGVGPENDRKKDRIKKFP